MDKIIRGLKEKDIYEALDLVWNVFKEFEAPDYSEDGINEFKSFIDYNNIFNMYNSKKLKLWGAFYKEELVGVIATRDISHISLLFVNKKYHRQGIGRELFSKVLEQIKDEGVNKITVNSSPYAIDVYHNIGFIDIDREQTINGIKFTPMKYIINVDI